MKKSIKKFNNKPKGKKNRLSKKKGGSISNRELRRLAREAKKEAEKSMEIDNNESNKVTVEEAAEAEPRGAA